MSRPQPSVADVRHFWNSSPLFAGESADAAGTPEWFEEHARVIIEDCFAGRFDDRTLPPPANRDRVLDLGCGPGFWTIELQRRCRIGAMTAADLTPRALELTRARLDHYGLDARLQIENAEALTFPDGSFGHVNCQGVIHHTPDTPRTVAEIARVLRRGGSASISVYYNNFALRNWRVLAPIASIAGSMGAGLRGRGREDIYRQRDAADIVRRYDGAQNPIGKAYDRAQFRSLLEPHFEVEEFYFHFFPARSLPVPVPKFIHRVLDAKLPFMIYATLRKP